MEKSQEQPGYPTGAPPAYGEQPPPAGYPGNQPPPAGYPSNQPPPAGYPGNQPPPAGYPGNQPPFAGYPGNQPHPAGYPGYPPPGTQPQGYGYPPPQPPGSEQKGYPQPAPGYPPPTTGYPQGYAQPPQSYVHPQAAYSQNTTTVITQPYPTTNIIQGQQYTQYSDNLLYFTIFTCICCCWPLGGFAIYQACQSKDAQHTNNISLAQQKARSARNFGIAAICCGIGLYVLIAIIRTVTYTSVTSSYYG